MGPIKLGSSDIRSPSHEQTRPKRILKNEHLLAWLHATHSSSNSPPLRLLIRQVRYALLPPETPLLLIHAHLPVNPRPGHSLAINNLLQNNHQISTHDELRPVLNLCGISRQGVLPHFDQLSTTTALGLENGK